MQIKTLLLVAFAATVCHSGRAAPDATPALNDPIVGQWIFHGDKRVVIHADGTAQYKSGMRGAWRYIKTPVVERSYEIVWDRGVYIDRFKLAADAKSLEGKDKSGKRIYAERAIESAK